MTPLLAAVALTIFYPSIVGGRAGLAVFKAV
jgi:hypothetical protein